MIIEECKIGIRVQRVQPGDYTNGRIGDVIELPDTYTRDGRKDRVRVLWHTLPSGIKMNTPTRTWVNLKRIIEVKS